MSGMSTQQWVWSEGLRERGERGRWIRGGERKKGRVGSPWCFWPQWQCSWWGIWALGCAHLGPPSPKGPFHDNISCPGDKLLAFCARQPVLDVSGEGSEAPGVLSGPDPAASWPHCCAVLISSRHSTDVCPGKVHPCLCKGPAPASTVLVWHCQQPWLSLQPLPVGAGDFIPLTPRLLQ